MFKDKQARRAKFANTSVSEISTSSPPDISQVSAKSSIQNYSEVKLQIRLPNGTALSETFGAKEPLSAVRLFIELNTRESEGPFNLMINFPKKVFGNEDYDKPLESLGKKPHINSFYLNWQQKIMSSPYPHEMYDK